ncbi:MAG: NPCBM/NEW2 domain-containing protein [Limisphaerales bacterium]
MKFFYICPLVFVALACAAVSSFAETVSLSSLDLKQMTVGWSEAKANLGIAGSPLRIHGVKFANGVGAHAASNFRVNVNGQAKRFAAQVGVDDSAGNQGSVEFIVTGDGKILWRSGVLKGGDAAKSVNVSLIGIKTLGLRVTDGGDGESNDHADWADRKN